MKINEGLSIILLLTVLSSTSVISEPCPPAEDIKPCKCYRSSEGVHVNCRDLEVSKVENLTEIFQKTLTGKKILDFEFKRVVLNKISSEFFKGLNIRSLYFVNCNITDFADKEGGPSFVGLEDSLKEFEILNSFYYTGDGVPGTLGHLRKLREIRIIDNYMPHIANGAFGDGSSSVKIIRLSNNNIKQLGDQVFSKAINVEEIFLEGNKLETLPRSIFPNPAKNLKALYLMYNGLESLAEDFFTNMPLLSDLDLSGNKLVELKEVTWKPVWSLLWSLDVDANPLDCGTGIEWTFDVRRPKYLYGSCATPENLNGLHLVSLIAAGKKEY